MQDSVPPPTISLEEGVKSLKEIWDEIEALRTMISGGIEKPKEFTRMKSAVMERQSSLITCRISALHYRMTGNQPPKIG